MKYFKQDGVPVSREEAFEYVEQLLDAKQYEKATAAFSALKKTELAAGVSAKPSLQLKGTTPLTQAKNLLRNPLAWQLVTEPGQKKPRKLPTQEAITLLQSLPLTHDDLKTIAADGNHVHLNLISYHTAWNTNWVLERLSYGWNYGVGNSIVKHTRNMDLIRKAVAQLAPARRNTATIISCFGDGSNLEDAELELVFNLKAYTVIGDARITLEQLYEAWHSVVYKETGEINMSGEIGFFLENVGKNPHATEALLEEIVTYCARSMSMWAGNAILSHPCLSGSAIEHYVNLFPQKDIRLTLAGHPNIRTATLRKLAKSKYLPLADLATHRLAEREKV